MNSRKSGEAKAEPDEGCLVICLLKRIETNESQDQAAKSRSRLSNKALGDRTAENETLTPSERYEITRYERMD